MKLLNTVGYTGYRKEVAERVDLDSDRFTYNYLLYDNDDLSDRIPIMDLAGKRVETDQYGRIELDMWLYWRDELATTLSVYLTYMGSPGVMVTPTLPDTGDILREAVKRERTNAGSRSISKDVGKKLPH